MKRDEDEDEDGTPIRPDETDLILYSNEFCNRACIKSNRALSGN